MTSSVSNGHAPYFALRDRLLGDLRTTVLTGEQLCEAGRLVHGRPEGLSLYGIPATEMQSEGIRLLGRTAVECCADAHAAEVADVLAALHAFSPPGGEDPLLVDLFCGSGNFSHHLGVRLGITVDAAELDPAVHAATSHNLGRVGADVRLHLGDYRDLLGRLPARSMRDTYFIDPPWPASTPAGLDLTRTSPPVPDILDDIRRSRDGLPCLIAIKASDRIAHDSLRLAFAKSHRLRSITPPPTLPHGANLAFHLYELHG
ncbi:hypothetical protein [Streptomyces sp. I05A-00742]|uniref:hypothetical protein n=1 Tax=Streptomyces sp. I05A-00742 TaxID=2732853 RepID=UPI00148826DF|nr:hypothetical protein [Streptomyces sp. I05A-00742]